MQVFRRRPSAAFVVAVFALCFAVVGSAIAGTEASKKALSKSQVKKIAKKQIKKAAPKLSVAHATSADTATGAATATNSDAPSLYAHVTVTGSAPNVDEARSKGFTDADFVDTGSPGVYCVNLPSGFKTVSGLQDEPLPTATSVATVHVLPDGGLCASSGQNGNTVVLTVAGGVTVRADFDLQVYR